MKTSLRELRLLRRHYPGVLWQHPVIAAVMPPVDAADWLARKARSLSDLPPFSLRVRSGSMVGEFGGRRWMRDGQRLKRTLIEHMGLKPTDRVLEVGCGAGRQALALADYLQPGGYVGFDVDEQAIRACRSTPALHHFRFFVADVENEVYRPIATTTASHYRFPLDDDSFDFVFLASVFTHMLEDDCANYAAEIMRVLAPGGTAAVSTYLRVPQTEGLTHRFAARAGIAYLEYPEVPAKLVAYDFEAFEGWFDGGQVRSLLGRWRLDGREQSPEWMDWIIIRAPS
jgi:SAM-dependent methyltransferase